MLLAEEKSLIVLLYTDWCSSCKHQYPIFQKISEKFPGISFMTLNLAKSRWIQDMIRVAGVPTFFFFKNGTQIFRATGDFSQHILETKIREKFESE